MNIRRILLAVSLAATAAFASTAIAKPEGAAHRIDITVTRRGFTPDHVVVKKGEPVTLAFTRKTDATCAKNVVVELGDGKKIQKDLPLDQTVEIAATFTKSGQLSYSCGMDMVHGVMTVE